jgi:parallel beta-helix repeat protein
MRIGHGRYIAILLPALVLGLAGSVFAGDGVTLIKQTPTTVFPINIAVPGSYRLASDLKVTSLTPDVIDIRADDVTLDLNGFSIIGPGSGIGINGASFDASVVTNGVVTAMAAGGVALGDDAVVEGVRAVANGPHAFDGIVVGVHSRVIGNVANNNISPVTEYGGVGIYCASGCLVSRNTANSNKFIGIRSGSGSLVFGNSVSSNFDVGIDLFEQTGYGKNVMENDAACLGTFGGTSMGDNVCNGVLQ